MGSVFSIVYNPSLFDECVLKLGVAAAAVGAFCPFNQCYYDGLVAVLPFCEPSATEPLEDCRAVLKELCNEHLDRGLDTTPGSRHRCLAFHTRPQREQSSIWRSRTVEAKKLHKAAAVQAQRKARRFARRCRLYGPPDWTDPALSLLPSLCLRSSTPNVLISPFPFAAPHIVLSPPLEDDSTDYLVSRENRVPLQDHAFGNRLIVGDPSSQSGPRPVIFNAAPPRTRTAAVAKSVDERGSDSDVPSLIDDEDDVSSCESSECGDVLSASLQEVSFRKELGPAKTPVLWIEEEEEGLPDIPASWLT